MTQITLKLKDIENMEKAQHAFHRVSPMVAKRGSYNGVGLGRSDWKTGFFVYQTEAGNWVVAENGYTKET